MSPAMALKWTSLQVNGGNRPQSVRLGSLSPKSWTSALLLGKHAEVQHVLPSARSSFNTHDYTRSLQWHTIKFAGDTTVVGLINIWDCLTSTEPEPSRELLPPRNSCEMCKFAFRIICWQLSSCPPTHTHSFAIHRLCGMSSFYL